MTAGPAVMIDPESGIESLADLEGERVDSLDHVSEISRRHGLVGEGPNAEDIVWDGAY